MKKQICTRLLLMLLAVAMALCCFACGDKDIDPDDLDDSEEQTQPEGAYADLPIVDFEERDVVIATLVGWGNDWTYDSFSGDVVNDSMYSRNVAFESTYHCNLTSFEDNNIHQIIYNNYISDSRDFDLIYPHPTTGIGLLLESGALADLKTSNILDLTGEGWNQNQVEAYTTNGKLYLGVCDASITGQGFAALVINRDLYDSYGLDVDIYELVREGDWTAQQMQEILTATASMNEGADKIYGLIDNHSGTYSWIYALGGSILSKDDDGEFICGLTQSSIVKLCESFLKIEGNDEYMLIGEAYNAIYPTSEMWTTFSAGRGLFVKFDVGASSALLRQLTFKRGYAPLPKADDVQSDYRVFCGGGLFAIPAKCPSFEQSCILLEYSAIHGAEDLKPSFFRSIINGALSDYPEDAEMLNLIHAAKIFDFGFTLDASKNLFTNYLRDNVYVTKSSGGAAIWLMTNKNVFQELIDTATALGNATSD